MQGFLLINKPQGKTSFGVCAQIKHICSQKRVGHTGTLDPMATGVLPVFIGRATVLSNYLLCADKSYTARVKLGITTDTLDITGAVLSEHQVNVSESELSAVLKSFTGVQKQVPPAYSAIKQNGVRAYDLARSGKEVKLEPREITVFELTQTEELKDGEFSFSCTVSKGTYIRSLVRDIGEALGCGATLTKLVRTKTAGFSLEDCVDLSSLTAENVKDYIMSPEKALPHIKSVFVTENQAKRFLNGGQLDLTRLKITGFSDGEIYKVMQDDNFLGLGFIDLENSQLAIKCVTGGE